MMMEVANTAAIFLVLLLIFLPLEKLFPAHKQDVLRREWGTDVLFFVGQYLLWTAPVVAVLVAVSRRIDHLPLSGLHDAVAAMPMWAQFFCVIFLSDVAIYWAHRLSHRVPILWRFHKVHHTAEKLDWMAAYREHPFDNLYTRLVENIPILLLGFPLHVIAGFAVFRGLWAVYIHSNVTLSPGPLRYLIGSSRLHHWHHDVDLASKVNFTNLSPVMDLIFGTFYDPGVMPKEYGIKQRCSHNYVHQLLDPLLPARFHAKPEAVPGTNPPQV